MRDGRIEQVGRPEEVYQRPTSRFTASFLGAANFFCGRVAKIADGVVTVAVPQGPILKLHSSREVGNEVTVALRPESISIAAAEPAEGAAANTVSAIVEQVIYHGFITHLHLRLPNGEPLLAFLREGGEVDGLPISPGTRVVAHWHEDAAQIVRDVID